MEKAQSVLLLPLLPRWYRRALGLPGPVSLDPDGTDHPDREVEEAALTEAAELVIGAARRDRRSLQIVAHLGALSRADRRFAELLVARGGPVVRFTAAPTRRAERRSRPARLEGTQREAWTRAALPGIDKALAAGLYRDACSRLRLTLLLHRRAGVLPTRGLLQRAALAFAARGRHSQATACQRWLLRHARSDAERCEALIALAVHGCGPRAASEVRAAARRDLAESRRLARALPRGPEQALLLAMWVNARALWLFRGGQRRLAMLLCVRACEVLLRADARDRFREQLAVQYTNAGRLAVELGDRGLAERCAERLGAIAEVYPPALERCGMLLARLGHHREAAEVLGAAVDAGLAMPRIHFQRAICRLRLGDVAGALEDISRVDSAWRGDARVPLLRAAALEEQGDLEGARRAYEEALRREPRRAIAWADLARIAWLEGDLAGAERALRQAVELAPERADLKARLDQIRGEEVA